MGQDRSPSSQSLHRRIMGQHASSMTPARYPESPARTDSSPQHLTSNSPNWNETITTASHFMTLANLATRTATDPLISSRKVESITEWRWDVCSVPVRVGGQRGRRESG